MFDHIRGFLAPEFVAPVSLVLTCATGCFLDMDAPQPSENYEQDNSELSLENLGETEQDVAGSQMRITEEGVGFRIPVDFRPECGYLRDLEEPPSDLTASELLDCLTDDDYAVIAEAYARRYETSATFPRTLAEYTAQLGDYRVADGNIRESLEGRSTPISMVVPGIEGPAFKGGSTSNWGANPSDCEESCLTERVSVVGATRTIVYRPAWAGPGGNPNTTGGMSNWHDARFLDDISYGSFPDFDQDDLSNSELQDAGCGPVSAINLFEWWNIPVYNGNTELTSFNSRANYIADRMDTLDGINFTDDEELIDFLIDYPRDLYEDGRISSYPGYHYSMSDSAAFKAMLNYISRGHPVIALYSTGSESLHWALITGYSDGTLKIANANDRSLLDFYNQWDDWEDLSWYADWAASLWVDADTFIAYTGWSGSNGIAQPDRFKSRSSTGSTLPSYSSGGTRYSFRYCLSGPDEIGDQAETAYFEDWWSEPNPSGAGYCMLNGPTTPLSFSQSPSSSVSARSGQTVTLQINNSSSLSSFATEHAGARCEFWGQRYDGSWTQLQSRVCSQSNARTYSFTHTSGSTRLTRVQFFIHTPDFVARNWYITLDTSPLVFYVNWSVIFGF